MTETFLTPEHAEKAFRLLFTNVKIEAMHKATMARDGVEWGSLIAINVEMIKRHLDLVKNWSSVHGVALSAGQKIEIRCAIDAALRRASTRPRQYAAPIYFSHRAASYVLDAKATGPGETARLITVEEHAVPLAAILSGTRLLADPDLSLRKMAHAILTPLCTVAKSEDPVDRKSHPEASSRHDGIFEIRHPFLRYHQAGIDVYKASDFARVDPVTFTWQDHLQEMAKFPLYASGIEFVKTL